MNIVIPVEILVRELEGKLWTALNLVDRGHTVLIGKTPWVHRSLDFFQADLVFIHGASYLLDEYDRLGVGMPYLDTEGGVFSSKSAYRKRITAKNQHEYVDTFFAWGKTQGEIAEEVGYDDVVVSGNPRFDLLHENLSTIYDDRAEQISDRLGRFILINTNFSRGNHIHNNPLSYADYNDEIENRTEWQENLCLDFVSLASELANNLSNVTVVIRPHPGENTTTYKNLLAESDDVCVEQSGNVRPWIKGSQMVIHNGCTTGIESALLNKQTLSYMPYKGPFGPELPNTVSRIFEDEDELLYFSTKHAYTDISYQIKSNERRELKEYFYNIDELAAPVVADEIQNIDCSYSGGYKPSMSTRLKRLFFAFAGDKVADKVQSTGIRPQWETSHEVFPYLSTNRFLQYLHQFNPVFDTQDIDVSRVSRGENAFILSKSS